MSASRRLYLDNAATSFPKPPSVLEAMMHYAADNGASAGRGGYAEAVAAGQILERCRAAICELINGESPSHVVFTLNCSDALNLAIKGLIDRSTDAAVAQEKPHVICTASDHNSMLRPITALADAGWIDVTVVPIDPITGLLDPADVRKAWRRSTRMICVTHASNVTGAVQPIAALGQIARERAVPLVVDAAQSVGHLPINVQRDHIDLLAAPGHKGLMGPLGTGFLYIRPGVERLLSPLREGGTGSRSDEPRQPEIMPDKYEAGSHNAMGIAGLLAGVEWLLERGVESIEAHGRSLVQAFIDGASDVEGLRYFGPQGVRDRIGVFSVCIDGIGPGALAQQLEARFGILGRAGLHCAPLLHKALGTAAIGGTTRVSFGPFVTVQDVRYVTDALASIAADRRSRGTQQSISDAIG
jgi:cysteine desulfurase / selenocysteine lyase